RALTQASSISPLNNSRREAAYRIRRKTNLSSSHGEHIDMLTTQPIYDKIKLNLTVLHRDVYLT
ncbi:MAG: hypothetical protein IJF48_05515, partial [Clostridia bacterium]|nr:hypothetical protein [Clostridia bacterium]